MKNQEQTTNIHEVIDFNEILNQDIYPTLEEMQEDGETITEEDVTDLITKYTIDYDLWQETDNVWYNEIYTPMMECIKEDFTIVK